MSTVAQLVDEVFRDYLEPADDQLVRVTLSGAVTDTATSWTYADGILAADEEDLLAPGTVVECEFEQVLITASDLAANTLTVRRAVNGTTAAAHVDGSLVTVAPVFGRQTVADAVADNVRTLYPRLWRSVTDTITTDEDPVDVSADAVTLAGFIYKEGNRYYDGHVALLSNFPPSATDKAVQFYGVPSGKTGYLTYRARFARPTATSDDLASLGVEAGWERIVKVGAAAQALGGREGDAAASEFVTEQVRAQGYPVLSAVRQAAALWQLRDRMLDEAARTLAGDQPVTTVMNTVVVR